ncbi:MAG TPA: pentapeptide repeat-containing protein [Ktedonobacterales bacterium]
MSGESAETQRAASAAPAAPVTPATPNDAYGQPISAERQAELRVLFERQHEWAAQPEAERGRSIFQYVRLSGADISWLAEQSGRDQHNDVPNLHLEKAIISMAHLEGADLGGAHLERANLRGAWLDSKTVLSDATLDRKTRLGDIQWSGVGAVNLTQIAWNAIPMLGDERGMTPRSPVADHDAAVRAYRQLAAQLRAQGMSEAADRFAERAQIRQRKRSLRQLVADWRRPWRLPGDLLRWLFSWFLALLAGYGYHPGRSVFWYLATIGGFAFLFFQATHGAITFGLPPSGVQPLKWYEALVLSVSSFHGRGFFQPTGQNGLGDPVAILAAAEAVFGVLIEISFIATFTQRFFGAK